MILKASPYLKLISDGDSHVAYHSLLGNAAYIGSGALRLIEEFFDGTDIRPYLTGSKEQIKCIKDLVEADLLTEEGEPDSRLSWQEKMRQGARSVPALSEGIVFLLTSDCNLTCSYCVADRDETFSGSACPELITKAISDYIELRNARGENSISPVISFSGGEPTLVFDVIQKACHFNSTTFPNVNFKYRITTNATLINRSIANFLRNHNFDVVVSVDIDKKKSQRLFKSSNNNSWDEAINGLKKLKNSGCRCSVSSVITGDETTKELEGFVLFLKGIGLDGLSVNIDNCSEIKEPIALASRLVDLVEFGLSVGFDVGGAWYVPAMEVFSKLDKRDMWASCSASSRVSLFVRPNGKITFCDYHPRVLGDVSALGDFFLSSSGDNPYIFGTHETCIGCEIEGFCAPCVLELEHLHRGKKKYLEKRCALFKECFRLILLRQSNWLNYS